MRGQYDAAFYLLYDILKSLLEEYAITKNVKLDEEKRTLRNINDRLKRDNLLNEEDYSIIKNLVIARNRMVHRRGELVIGVRQLEEAKRLARILIMNLN